MAKSEVSLDERIQKGLLTLLKLSVMVAFVIALSFHNWGAAIYCLLTFGLMSLPILIRSQANIRLPIEFDVVLVVFMYASVFLGKVGLAYERFWWWDAALHASSGFIIAFIGFIILAIKLDQKRIQASQWLLGLIIFSFALALGAIWEIFEFTLDKLTNGNLQRGSLDDTMWDLIVDSMGALIMAWFGMKQLVEGHRGIISRAIQKFVSMNPKLKGANRVA